VTTSAQGHEHPPAVYRGIGPERVTHGPACSRELGVAVMRADAGRAVVITGPTIAQNTALLWYIEQVLGPLHAASYTGVQAHSPADTVAEAAELVQAAAGDCIVSLGGGSAIDTAKAVAAALAGDGEPPPHIALPTTLSAAEFTFYAGVTNPETRVKEVVRDPRLAPREVFLDPTLTLATPPRLWLSSGIKALDHALESMLNPRHHPVTDALALEAARTLVRVLPACAADAGDLTARGDAQVAAWQSLFSPGTSRGGLSHALGHQLGAHGVPHGITSCITLPWALRFTAPVSGVRQWQVAHALDLGAPLPDAVADLVGQLGLPGRLRDTDLSPAELPAIAEAAYHEARAVSLMPLAGPLDLLRLLEAMW
jgi:maleylacetate reductase